MGAYFCGWKVDLVWFMNKKDYHMDPHHSCVGVYGGMEERKFV